MLLFLDFMSDCVCFSSSSTCSLKTSWRCITDSSIWGIDSLSLGIRMFRQISRRVVGDGNGTSFASADWLSVMQDDWVTCLPGFRTRSNHAWLMNLRLRARTSASDAISWMDRKVAHRRNAAPRQNSHATLPRIFVKAPRIVVAWSLPHFVMTPDVRQSKRSPRVVSMSGMHRVTYASDKALMQNTPGSFFFEI